jgi:FG-GAP-like repeat
MYREDTAGWKRTVIDTSLEDGHALVTRDLDGDGADEIIAGFRGGARSVYIYSGSGWQRTVLDNGGMAAANCTTTDVNGDGKPDVVCIGSATHNIKWYENVSDVRH